MTTYKWSYCLNCSVSDLFRIQDKNCFTWTKVNEVGKTNNNLELYAAEVNLTDLKQSTVEGETDKTTI